MRVQRLSNHKELTLDDDNVIGAGGEARIYTVKGDESIVAKIYHKPPNKDHVRKLTVMLDNPPEDPMADQGHASIAWPIDLLRSIDEQPRIIGFLMPRVTGIRPVIDVYNPGTRRLRHPWVHYRFLHRAARNLASAVRALHVRGYVIGDVNESNILVTDTALVTLVDTDSFQVKDPANNRVYRCPVGKAEFTPPELQGRPFSEVDRSIEHDLFGLGVVVFHLLMEGTHPFMGIYTGQGEDPPYESRISSGHFPYSKLRDVPWRPPPIAPPFKVLTPTTAHLFVRCFDDGHDQPAARPDAATWRDALKEAEEGLKVCDSNPQHWYGNHITNCPWCSRTKQLAGRDPFPSPEAVQRGEHLMPSPSQSRTRVSHSYSRHHAPNREIPRTPPPPPTSGGTFWVWPALLAALASFVPFFNPWAGGAALLFAIIGFLLSSDRTLRRYVCAFCGLLGIATVSISLMLNGFNLFDNGSIDPRAIQETVLVPEHSGAVYSVAFAPDGKTLAGGISDNTIRIWDPNKYDALATLEGHTSFASSLAYSPNGKILASGSWDRTIRLWDVEQGIQYAVLQGHESEVRSVVFSPNGRVLASAGSDGTIRLWDVVNAAELVDLRGHTRDVTCLAFAPTGLMLASGSADHTVRLWDLESTKMLQTLQADGDTVNAVAFSADGKYLATGSWDRAVRVWDMESGRMIKEFKGRKRSKSDDDQSDISGHSDAVRCVAFSPIDNQLLASGGNDHTVRLWNLNSEKPVKVLKGHGAPIYSLAFAPDGDTIATGSLDDTVRVWEVKDGLPKHQLNGLEAKVWSVVFSPDGLTVASGGEDKEIRLWDVHNHQLRQSLTGHAGIVRDIDFSPNGKMIASASDDHTVRVWDATTGLLLNTLEGHSFWVYAVAFSPDGNRLVSGGWDETVVLWNLENGTTKQITGHEGAVQAVAFSNDGKVIASGGGDGDNTVRLWDARDGSLMTTLLGHQGEITDLAFSPDGTSIASASGDFTVRVWDIKTGTFKQELRGHTGPVESVIYSRDGKILITAGADQAIRIWSAGNSELQFTLTGHSGPVLSVDIDDASSFIASGGMDTTVRLWPLK